jgi:hypothetical protein
MGKIGSEAPRPQGGASQYFFKRAELAEARNPPSPRLRRVVLPFIPVLPHGAFWRRRVNKRRVEVQGKVEALLGKKTEYGIYFYG